MHARTILAAAILVLACAALGTPASAQSCKDVVTAKSRSTAKISDAAREQRARDNAIKRWKKEVQRTHGWLYSFWTKADDKKVECGSGPRSKHCTVSAKPCKVL